MAETGASAQTRNPGTIAIGGHGQESFQAAEIKIEGPLLGNSNESQFELRLTAELTHESWDHTSDGLTTKGGGQARWNWYRDDSGYKSYSSLGLSAGPGFFDDISIHTRPELTLIGFGRAATGGNLFVEIFTGRTGPWNNFASSQLYAGLRIATEI